MNKKNIFNDEIRGPRSLKGKMATAPHVLTQLMRLHQITCGHLKNDDDTITEIKNNRMSELLDVLMK